MNGARSGLPGYVTPEHVLVRVVASSPRFGRVVGSHAIAARAHDELVAPRACAPGRPTRRRRRSNSATSGRRPRGSPSTLGGRERESGDEGVGGGGGGVGAGGSAPCPDARDERAARARARARPPRAWPVWRCSGRRRAQRLLEVDTLEARGVRREELAAEVVRPHARRERASRSSASASCGSVAASELRRSGPRDPPVAPAWRRRSRAPSPTRPPRAARRRSARGRRA